MAYRNILLIDDDEDDQDIFLTALTKISADTTCAVESNGHNALRDLENGQLNPDVIFLDLNMPEMNGQEFLVAVKKKMHLRHIPIIILSTSSHAATKMIVKDLGALDFLTKPDNFDDLVAMLRTTIS